MHLYKNIYTDFICDLIRLHALGSAVIFFLEQLGRAALDYPHKSGNMQSALI